MYKFYYYIVRNKGGEKEMEIEQKRKEKEMPLEDLYLVLEMATKGTEPIVAAFDPNEWKGRRVGDIVELGIEKILEGEYPEEEKFLANTIKKIYQSGGNILYESKKVGKEDEIIEYTILSESEEGLKYLLIHLEIIKPEEGGLRGKWIKYL